MSFDEYYRRLSLPLTASPGDIKRAYRRLRAQYHPDRNKGRESAVEPAFRQIQEAFEILTGKRVAPMPESRASDPRASTTNPKSSREAGPAHTARYGPPMRGANCLVELFVPLEVAIEGGGVEASFPVKGPCPSCHSDASSRHCAKCQGAGVLTWRKSETVAIPTGAWDGQRLVVEGGGHPGINGGPAGDAIFTVALVCAAGMRRNGLDLVCAIDVDFVTATLGGRIEARVLGRTQTLTIPPNAQPGATIRLPGLGLADRQGARGDVTLELQLTMPAAAAHLSPAEREQLREMFARAQQRADLATRTSAAAPAAGTAANSAQPLRARNTI